MVALRFSPPVATMICRPYQNKAMCRMPMLKTLPRLASALQFARIQLSMTAYTHNLCACHRAGTSGRSRVANSLFQVRLGALCGSGIAGLNICAFVCAGWAINCSEGVLGVGPCSRAVLNDCAVSCQVTWARRVSELQAPLRVRPDSIVRPRVRMCGWSDQSTFVPAPSTRPFLTVTS